jgi:hypothetical protein
VTGQVRRVGGDAHDRPALSTPRVPSSDIARARVAIPLPAWFIASMGTVGGGPGRARTRTGPVREARPDHESAESAGPGCAPSTGAVRDVQCAARPTAAERHTLLPRPEPGRRSARPSCPVPGRRCPGVAGTGPPPGALGRGRPGVGRRRSGGAEALALRERVPRPFHTAAGMGPRSGRAGVAGVRPTGRGFGHGCPLARNRFALPVSGTGVAGPGGWLRHPSVCP